ncbi:hypothetical protein WN943_000838 [Citrus x changshan-huyou]
MPSRYPGAISQDWEPDTTLFERVQTPIGLEEDLNKENRNRGIAEK